MTEPSDVRYEAYASLMDNRLRKVWVSPSLHKPPPLLNLADLDHQLYQLYLCPDNADLLRKLYINPCSSNLAVQMTIERQLHHAAKSEIVKASTCTTIVEADLMRDAAQAFEALSALLGQNDWFFGQERPGLLDASVFAYTYLVLRGVLDWRSNALTEMLEKNENLLSHRRRILDLYY